MEKINWQNTLAAVWRSEQKLLRPVRMVDLQTMDKFIGIDYQKTALIKNTESFLAGKPFNHVLLWGARGTGKSSMVKALLDRYHVEGLRVVEVQKFDLYYLPDITDQLYDAPFHFLLYCDDLSFQENEPGYCELKSVLQGSIEKPPENIMLITTSNRRHLIPEYMQDNLQATPVDGEIHPGDSIEEKMSLSDRFGLSLSFHPMSQQVYLEIIDGLFSTHEIKDQENLHIRANRFARERGSCNGRIAQQFYQRYADEEF